MAQADAQGIKPVACPVVMEASHISVLEFVDLAALKAHAVKE